MVSWSEKRRVARMLLSEGTPLEKLPLDLAKAIQAAKAADKERSGERSRALEPQREGLPLDEHQAKMAAAAKSCDKAN